MSAWIVDKAVIDLLVEAVFRYELVTDMTLDALGQMLWKENYRSVNYRYHEQRRTPRYTHTSYRVVSDGSPAEPLCTIATLARDPLAVLNQLRCYDYQSCEHPGWDASRAFRLLGTLKDALHCAIGLEGAALSAALAPYPWGIAYPRRTHHAAA